MKRHINDRGDRMTKLLRKLFGGLNLTWPKLILRIERDKYEITKR